MRYLLLITFSLSTFLVIAQRDSVIFKNIKEIDKNRYEDIKGSSYLFDDFIVATLFDRKGLAYKGIKVNYNGDDRNLEALKSETEYITVIPSDVPRIVIKDVESTGLKDLQFMDSLVMVHAPHLQTKSNYLILLYKEKGKMLLLEFHVALSTVIERPPGAIIERKRFNKSYKLILKDKKGLTRIKMKNKDIAQALSKYGNITKFCKDRKLKVSSFEGVTLFMQDYTRRKELKEAQRKEERMRKG